MGATPGTGTGSPGGTVERGGNTPGGTDALNRSDTGSSATSASIGPDWIAAQSTPSDKLVGADVVNAQNETIGEVEEIVTHNGRNSLVVSVGAFLGMGGHKVALDLERATVFHRVDDMNEFRVLTDMTEEQLKSEPKYEPTKN
ncbi:MAG: PRC-barrel domain-containing protein [Alphaproteobacteria bacterium]